jgi:hypothetical protein
MSCFFEKQRNFKGYKTDTLICISCKSIVYRFKSLLIRECILTKSSSHHTIKKGFEEQNLLIDIFLLLQSDHRHG